MSGFYDGSKGRRTYRFAAAALETGAVVGRLQGPIGKIGRVVGFEYVLTAGVTDAAVNVAVDTNAGLTTPFSVEIPILAINLGGAASRAELAAGDELPADTVAEIQAGGECTVGDGDLIVTIVWY
jgi:hypothetical protein